MYKVQELIKMIELKMCKQVTYVHLETKNIP